MKKRTAALGMLLLPLYILTACGVEIGRAHV